MRTIFYFGLVVLLIIHFTSCNSQTQNNNQVTQKQTSKSKIIGGGCDGCEIMYIGMPANIEAIDTSAGWNEKGRKLVVKGIVYKPDGKTPAANVVMYYWQTDNDGFYSAKPGMHEKTKRHGHIRGWVKSDKKGKYAICTIRPAPYPNENMPAHIHISIKEPDLANEYYIDELVFDDDKLLTAKNRKQLENRGGTGILKVTTSGNRQVAEHNVILGLNIPDYPKKQ